MFRMVDDSLEYGRAFEPNEEIDYKLGCVLCTMREFSRFTPENRSFGSNTATCSPWGLGNLGSAPCKCLPGPGREVGSRGRRPTNHGLKSGVRRSASATSRGKVKAGRCRDQTVRTKARRLSIVVHES
jgi:hypothetical protein